MTTKELLERYDLITHFYLDINYHRYSCERALYFLLKDNEKHIEGKIEYDETGEWLHKSFRQVDVTGSSNIDLSIWHLLQNAPLFWMILRGELNECYNDLKNKK